MSKLKITYDKESAKAISECSSVSFPYTDEKNANNKYTQEM